MRTSFKWLLLLLPTLAYAGPVGPNGEITASVYNPYTGRTDFITAAGGGGGGGASTLEVFDGPVRSSPTASISLAPLDFSAQIIGGTTFQFSLNPATTDFIHNQTTAQSATFFVSSGTATDQFNTKQVHFIATGCIATALDGTCIMSRPDVNSQYDGYNTNLINTGGTFDYAAGPTAMPYPGSGNFNSCVGPFCMSGNVITIAENNNGMGYASCGALRAGFYNSCMGGSSGNHLRDGNYNSWNGAYSGFSVVDANGTTYSGFEAGRYSTADYDTGVGYQAGQGSSTVNANILGTGNTWLGKNTGQDIPNDNVINYSFAVGDGALYHASGEGQLGGRLGSGKEVMVRMASGTVETGYFKVHGQDVCLADGTNCPASSASSEFKVSLSTGTLGFLVSSVSNNYTIASTSTVILADASGTALTVTLPTAVGATGKLYRVKRLNSGVNAVTIATTSSQTIDGATTQILNLQYTSVDLISDGSNWSIL